MVVALEQSLWRTDGRTESVSAGALQEELKEFFRFGVDNNARCEWGVHSRGDGRGDGGRAPGARGGGEGREPS